MKKYNYDDDGIIQMIKDNISIKDISNYYDIPYNTMLYHCRRLVNSINKQRRINRYKKRGYHIASRQELYNRILITQEMHKIKEDSL